MFRWRRDRGDGMRNVGTFFFVGSVRTVFGSVALPPEWNALLSFAFEHPFITFS